VSHVVTCKGEFNDLDIMRRAGEQLGARMVEANTYKWWGTSVGDYPVPEGFKAEELGTCHYKFTYDQDGPYRYNYEVGIIDIQQLPQDHPARAVYKNQRYILQYDFIDPRLSEKFGRAGAAGFLAAYAEQAARRQASKQRATVKTRTLDNGNKVIELWSR
jgi:hypothetical protein